MALTQHRRLLASLTVIGSAALVLTGCTNSGGGGGGGSTESSGGGGGSQFDGTTLEVAAAWTGAEQANFEKILKKFEEDTGAKVNYTSFGDKAATTLGTQIEGGSPPNVALLAQPALLQQLAKDGNLKPLSDEVLDVVKQNYSQSWIDLGSVDGKTYGVWFKGSNKSTVWYNKDIYDGAGATVPEDWDGFLKQLQLISDSGYAGISIGADVGWPLTDWFENVYLRTAGGEKYDQLTNHEIPWTDPSVEEALKVLQTLWGNKALIEDGAAQRTFPESVTEVFGADPKAGTVYEGDFVAGNIADDGNSTVGKNALFYNFPAINGSGPAVVGGGDAAVAFTDDDATNALMKFLASPESAEIWVPEGGLTSPNKSVDTSLYPDAISKQIAEALTGAETFRFDMSDLTPSAFGGTEGQGFWQIMIKFLQDPSDISGTQQALEDAAKAAYK
ncbi:ABC transporter substrate-binding protein [Cryobacterium tepidiphilum]|jgi:alpha-glucoside transport system substrate-binding protein|uniref:Carbohydrate ABC transporter substrate-binding protein n=1 Tax=Cryobacterium tepidiphilum TaxID=2486026 RepID=A0A3M8L9K6_9MICO|nr:ABC transporter substrate-binding protein [Cryobacterium tepidiphilum]RNE62171.1 carbohydrate ABC transporter substrate-binding protein [Cryobacterium tepidiphilum]